MAHLSIEAAPPGASARAEAGVCCGPVGPGPARVLVTVRDAVGNEGAATGEVLSLL